MAGYPVQTFTPPPDLPALLNYMNTLIVTNGHKEITAVILNNVVNALAEFIPDYTVNGASDGAAIVSTGGALVLSRPITIITTVATSSITWNDNVQQEYYIKNNTNTTLSNVKQYLDENGAAKTTIPGKGALHIAKATNGSWVQIQVSNPGTSTGGGGNGQGNLF